MTNLKKQESNVNKRNNQSNLHILFTQEEHETIDFTFSQNKVNKFIELWNDGYSIFDIADKINRTHAETWLLAMDLSISKRIKARDGAYRGMRKIII